MKRKGRLPELLSPAGDFECLLAAVKGGADAVYVGGKSFGARAFAGNFDLSELERAVIYCHLHGVKLYVTVNTLLSDSEIHEALEFCEKLYLIGVDALIVADLGLVGELKRRLPDFELHASTQMSVHNAPGADVAYSLGCSRVVLARELTRENITEVTEKCMPETEVFVHGAICVSTSGQCLFSSLVGGRSGNRGECAQPCRLPYGKGYPLSMSDMSLAGHVRELIATGVASLKIEGRMKSPDYVYKVTSIYRRLLDGARDATVQEREELKRVFSRGGFTDGYFVGRIQSRGMTGVRSEADKKSTRESENGVYTPERVEIFADCEIKLGAPSRLTLRLPDGRGTSPLGFSGGRGATALGPLPDRAINAPLTEPSVKQRLSKMGNTYFSLPESNITLYLDDGVNLPPSALNGLRRAASELLEKTVLPKRELKTTPPPADRQGRAEFSESKTTVFMTCSDGRADFSRKNSAENPNNTPSLPRTALFFSPKVLSELDASTREYFDAVFIPLWRLSEYKGKVDGVYMPPTVSESEIPEVEEMLRAAKDRGIEYALVGGLGHINMCRDAGFKLIGDFRLNATNSYTVKVLRELGICDCVLSAELTPPAVKRIGGRAIVYGRVPLMLTERCFMKENFGCDKCSKVSLTDRRGVSFPIIREYPHRNIILNSAVTYMGDKDGELSGGEAVMRHFIFTLENGAEVARAVSAYKSRSPLTGVQVRRMGRR